MKSILSLVAVGATFLSTANAASEPYPEMAIAMRDGLKALTYVGCFTSSGTMTFNSNYTYQTQGSCQESCVSLTGGPQYAVLGTTDSVGCWCGNSEPPASDKVDDDECSSTCAGYGTDFCGGDGLWSIWLTGQALSASASAEAASATAKVSSSTSPNNPTMTTVINGVTVTATAAASTSGSKSGPSKAAIAAGVVVGLVLFAAVAGGMWAFMRHRRRREIEEQHARHAAVSSFIGSSKPPSTSTYFSDPRIDSTVLAQRRMSDGSIADNQDYSRRILKVTNA